MKKLSFLIVVLLILTMVTCEVFTPEKLNDEARTIVTEDGRTLVELTIGVTGSGGRALTDIIARVATERYEVAFRCPHSGLVYRTSWRDGEVGRLWVNTTNASDADGVVYGNDFVNAILFAGSNNGTLLAVGNLVQVDGAPGWTIFGGSRTVTFALTPLTNDVYGYTDRLADPPNHPDPYVEFGIEGTFVIDYTNTAPDGPDDYDVRPTTAPFDNVDRNPPMPSDWFDVGQPGDPLGDDLPWALGTPEYDSANEALWVPGLPAYNTALGDAQKAWDLQDLRWQFFNNYFIEIGGVDYGVFYLKEGEDDVEAVWSITGLPAAGIMTSAPATVTPRIIELPGYLSTFGVLGEFDMAGYDAAGTTVVGAGVNATTDFDILLSTKSAMGLVRLSFDIPVNAINNTPQAISLNTEAVAPGTWYIRGGINNSAIDAGFEDDSVGGAILVGVGLYREDSTTGWIDVTNTGP
jgi:hypothetical protein